MRLMMTIALALLAVAAGGCASSKEPTKNEKISHWLLDANVDVPPAVYRVQPPDKIAVMAPKVKEINGQGGTIRSDGKVVFNLIGEVDVAGKTCPEIAELLARMLSKYYSKEALDIAVQVTEFKSKSIYVFGQVNAGGIKPYTGRDSVLKVLADSGLTDDAWAERVVVVRPHEDPNIRQKITLDLSKMYETGDTSNNILLEEGDLIYVPPTPLSRITRFFDKVLITIKPATVAAEMAMTGGL